MYDKANHSFNDHFENEKNPESWGKGILPYEGERTNGRKRLRGKIRKRGNLDRVLIANMTMLNSPPGRAPRLRVTLELVSLLLNYVSTRIE